MNLIDILVWVVLLAFVIKGFMKGLVREVCSLVGLVMGIWAACKYYQSLSEAIRYYIHIPHSITIIFSFILIFLTIGLLFFFLGNLLTAIFKIALLGGVNRLGGAIFGLIQGALVLCLLLYFGTAKPVPAKLKLHLERSGSARPFITCGRDIISGWEAGSRQPAR
ncbi:MAG TPA: CvpA family protein [Geobacteraceae bacterium]|nr:CvpA family protein [Geobacteraceae bacterium]